jgi:hypothetical protein
MSMRRALAASVTAVLSLWLVSGCGTSGSDSGPLPHPATSVPVSPTTPPVSPTTSPVSPPAGSYAITGVARSVSGSPEASVGVGFQLTTASCSTCDVYDTVTDSTGRYALHLPAGTYLAQCVAASGLTCLIASTPPAAAARVHVVSNGTMNLLVSTSTSPTTPAPPAPTTTPVNPAGSGDVVSGHILTSSGQPVPNASITFRMARCPDCEPQPHTETHSDGSYSITLPPGVYNAECDVIGVCKAQGTSGGGVPVNIPPGGTLNFIVEQ